MENKKEFYKKLLIIISILIIAMISFFLYENEEEDYFIYNQIDLNEGGKNSTNIITVNENNVENETLSKIKIYITGEVNNPGVKELDDGARIEDAINIAGGITSQACLSKVNLAYYLEDGQKIYIPNVNETIDEYITIENGEGIVEDANSNTLGRININKADVNGLCELPGVGESLAIRIIAYREENGKFKTIDDLKNVSGIGEKKFESLRQYIVVK